MGQRLTVRRLKEMQRVYLPDLLFLVETKQQDDYVRDVGVGLGYDDMCIVPPHGLSGGLVVFWKKHVSVQVLSSDSRLVDLFLEYKSFKFYLSCVYGNPIPKNRHHLWEKLQRIATQRVGPWMMCGDFNEIMNRSEKKGGKTRNDGSFKNFRLMTQVCGMEDLKSKGNPFSWVGRRRSEIIECCLDRVMVNSEWKRAYPESENEYLELAESDHRPMIVNVEYEHQTRKGQFRYNKRLFLEEDFADTVRRSWKGGWRRDRTFSEKMVKCRSEMAKWKRRNRTNAAEKIQDIRRRIDYALRDVNSTTAEIHRLRQDLNKAFMDEEYFWKRKSRNRWLKMGDRNTRFFHGSTKARRARNSITKIQDDHGIIHRKDDAIAKVAGEYFQGMFSTSNPQVVETGLVNLRKTVTVDMNAMLTSPVTNQEIKDVVFLINPDRAPGSDGYTAAFYQQFWSDIEEDVCNMVRNFFETREMEKGINHTQICLIPKITEAVKMSDYRPISLCTINYKIISKILVMRLKNCLGSIISENQAAFVPGRNISDNLLVAHELLHAIKSKKDCAENFLAIKTDISKAYDRVEWCFLKKAMEDMGFNDIWINWTMKCVTSVSYSVLINGADYGRIQPTRCIRQGDPLSPYLFLLCAEVLSQMISNAERMKRIQGIKISRYCPTITHLLFADDSLFFCRATKSDCEQMDLILKTYEEISGQKVNFEKSSIIFGMKIGENHRMGLQRILGITRVGGGGKYLGLPEQFGRSKTENFSFVVDRIRNKTSGWYNKFLSPAGKEILIKSVLQSIPVYPMNCFLIPKGICDQINSILSEFWWGSNNGKRKISWVSWKKLCFPKVEGGMGFRDLHSFNLALLAKQAWRIFENPSSMIARIYKARYHNTSSFSQSLCGTQTSYGWKSIHAGKELLLQGMRVQLGDGKNTNVWSDCWLPTLPPRRVMNSDGSSPLTVSDLWKDGERDWDMDKLEAVLCDEDVSLAKQIGLSNYNLRDMYVWPYNKDAKYSVKSGYWVATHFAGNDEIVPPHGSHDLKKEVWKLKILPKIQHFLWKAISGALPTTERMIARNIKINPLCQRCCLEEETINHVLFECIHTQAIWRCSQIPMLNTNFPSEDLEENIRKLLVIKNNKSIPSTLRLLPFWLMWMIWKSRNEFMFNNRNVHPNEEVNRSFQAVEEWLSVQNAELLTDSREHAERSSQWEPPPEGWVKCNFDSSYHKDKDSMGTGWIIRDHNGKHVVSGVALLRQVESPLQAEAMGFIHALQTVWALGFRHVWFEGDNKELVSVVNKQENSIALGNLLYDIRFWISKLPMCSLDHIHREKNQAADVLAKKAFDIGKLYDIFKIPPTWLVNTLYFPYTI